MLDGNSLSSALALTPNLDFFFSVIPIAQILSHVLLVKTTDFQLVFNFEQTRTVTIFGNYGIMAHILMMAKPIRTLDLHCPMI